MTRHAVPPRDASAGAGGFAGNGWVSRPPRRVATAARLLMTVVFAGAGLACGAIVGFLIASFAGLINFAC